MAEARVRVDADEETATGARARTRRAILDAAISAIAEDPAVSLGQIADAARVGRTTLHRYFPERSDLVDAVSAEAFARLRSASDRVRVSEGTGREALLRLAQEYLELGDVLTLMFNETVPECTWVDPGEEEALVTVVRRGLEDGSLDPALADEWVQGTMWSLLYLAWATLRGRTMSRHDVVASLLRTLDRAVRPGP